MDNNVLEALQVDPKSVKKLLNFLPYPFLIAVHQGGGINTWGANKLFEEEFGYTLDEVKTIEDWFELAYPDENYRQGVKESWMRDIDDALANGKGSVTARAKIFTRTKGYQWYEVKSSLPGDLEFVAFVNVNDVVEKELELARANANKNRVLSILGHDLRGPIFQLNKLTEFILKGHFSPEELLSKISSVHDLSKLSLQFLETTLVWTRSNFEEVTIKKETIDLEPWLSNLCALYKETASEKSIELIVDTHKGQQLIADPIILHVVLRNLLTNAIKFSDNESQVMIVAEKTGDNTVISVSDSGKGMDQNAIDAIMANKIDINNKAIDRSGFGIGLSLCRGALVATGGELSIDSSKGQGTKVSVYVPNQ